MRASRKNFQIEDIPNGLFNGEGAPMEKSPSRALSSFPNPSNEEALC